MQFEDLRLIEPIRRAIALEGYTVPTPIQAKAIPHILEGRDLLGCAQTGTGKTAAFAWPILQRLSMGPKHAPPAHAPAGKGPVKKGAHERGHGQHGHQGHQVHHGHTGRGQDGTRTLAHTPRALVLAPTRELASQITESFSAYGSNLHLRATAIFGGVSQHHQVRALKQGVDIVVATPGRLLDLMGQGYVDVSKISVLVLDEADHMLDMGFIPDVRRIVKELPAERQTLMFSATMPHDIRHLADSILRKPVEVAVTPVASTVETVEQRLYHVSGGNKPALLVHLLQNGMSDRAVVFTRTKHRADKVVKVLLKSGIRAEAIHGNKSQNARTRTLESFKSDKPPVLVATDIAARGIDVDNVSHVFNFDLPQVPETYVHRIGRTARAGASGMAVSFCDENEHGLLRAIERLTGQRIETADVEHGQLAKGTDAEAGWGDRARRQGSSSSSSRGGYASSRSHGGGGRTRQPGGREGRSAAQRDSHPVSRGSHASGTPRTGGVGGHHGPSAHGKPGAHRGSAAVGGAGGRAGAASGGGTRRAGGSSAGGAHRGGAGASSGERPSGFNQRGRGKPRRR